METDKDNDKHQRILSAAISVFSKNGYERVKVNDITEAAGVGKGTFYLYFKNKEELLLECFDQLQFAIARLEAEKRIRTEKDFHKRVINRWLLFNEFYLEIGQLLHLLRNECNSSNKTIREKARKSFDHIISPLRADFQKAMQNKQIQEMDPEFAAYLVVGIAESFSFRVNSGVPYNGNPTEIFCHSIESIFMRK